VAVRGIFQFKWFHLNPYLLALLLYENGQKAFSFKGASPC